MSKDIIINRAVCNISIDSKSINVKLQQFFFSVAIFPLPLFITFQTHYSHYFIFRFFYLQMYVCNFHTFSFSVSSVIDDR